MGEQYLPSLPASTTSQLCATFMSPPLDGTLSLCEMVEWNAHENANHPLFVYPGIDSGGKHSILWPEVATAIRRAAKIVETRLGGLPDADATTVVATLASTDTISYVSTFIGIMRANCTPFQMSPRNSASAVAHLLVSTGAKHLFVGHDQAMRDIARQAITIITEHHPGVKVPELSDIPLFDDLFRGNEVDESNVLLHHRHSDALAFLLHSSGRTYPLTGSTSFPKVNPWTERHTLEVGLTPFFGSRNLSGKIMSLHGLPAFHGLVIAKFICATTSGYILSTFEPLWPPVAPTPEHCFEGMKATDSDFAMCVPSFIEAWAVDEEHVKWFASKDGIIFSGGPLSKEAGDKLARQGVKIFSMYGSTDTGILSEYLPADVGMEWDYIKFTDWAGMKMTPNGDNSFEYTMLASPFCTPCVVNARIDGLAAFATSDLFIPHPTKPGYWKLFGRNDDQIMHSTGEKTNPGPLEHILNKDQHVAFGIMFGRGRFNAGVIIEPSPEWTVDPDNETAVAEYRNKVWPTVEEMNKFAPQHSRIFKEMILLATPTKPFSLTSKNTPRRQIIIKDYEDEINTLYDTVEQSTQAAPGVTVTGWDETETRIFVRAVVTKVLVGHGSPDDDNDLFQFGCDSLQATWIRNTLLRTLRETAQIDTRGDADNFVYHYPTIRSLAAYLSKLAAGGDAEDGSMEVKVQHMLEIVEKYTSQLPSPNISRPSNSTKKERVLLTGPTGALGSHILARLLASDAVDKVVALGRRAISGVPLHTRLVSDFRARGLDVSLLDVSSKLVLLEGDLVKENFALTAEQFELTKGTTSIIHNAWRVDFNLGLRSFESNINGLRRLLDLSFIPNIKKFYFLSTYGVFHHAPPDVDLSEIFVPPEWASGNGYSQSKWVGERILEKAFTQFPTLSPTIIRTGQLSGGPNGAWNKQEWVPTMVQSATKIGMLPIDKNEEKCVSWLPIHTAADAIVRIIIKRETSRDVPRVVHLVNPKPIRWRILAEAFVNELHMNVQLVPYDSWLAKLEAEAHSSTPEELHALRFLHFFRVIGDSKPKNREAFGLPSLQVGNDFRVNSLEGSTGANPTLGKDDVERWVGYWRKAGLFTT
ncbi:acetyl-CoA synthetase-like protein [Collybia nuda]|uniref:Acetyl-CoA synthetase-like protein n=1 Tax=Collybia nuda TaxID=64659 RepID=A0A9P6CCQ6_9AGAR|nr:acetyl-CoA synthetase-like protein [Collybia nuda]